MHALARSSFGPLDIKFIAKHKAIMLLLTISGKLPSIMLPLFSFMKLAMFMSCRLLAFCAKLLQQDQSSTVMNKSDSVNSLSDRSRQGSRKESKTATSPGD